MITFFLLYILIVTVQVRISMLFNFYMNISVAINDLDVLLQDIYFQFLLFINNIYFCFCLFLLFFLIAYIFLYFFVLYFTVYPCYFVTISNRERTKMQVKRIGSLEKANSSKKKKKQPEIIKTINPYSQAIVISRKSLGGKTTKMQPAAEVRTARGQNTWIRGKLARPLEDLKVVEVASWSLQGTSRCTGLEGQR